MVSSQRWEGDTPTALISQPRAEYAIRVWFDWRNLVPSRVKALSRYACVIAFSELAAYSEELAVHYAACRRWLAPRWDEFNSIADRTTKSVGVDTTRWAPIVHTVCRTVEREAVSCYDQHTEQHQGCLLRNHKNKYQLKACGCHN